jgi:hypothetical protein
MILRKNRGGYWGFNSPPFREGLGVGCYPHLLCDKIYPIYLARRVWLKRKDIFTKWVNIRYDVGLQCSDYLTRSDVGIVFYRAMANDGVDVLFGELTPNRPLAWRAV